MTAAYLALVISLIPTVFVYFRAKENIRERERIRFEEMIRTVMSTALARLDSAIAVLRATKGLFAASDHVTRPEWESYIVSSGVKAHLPRMMSLGFVQRVAEAETNQHIAQMRTEGMPDYKILGSSSRPEHFPIVYLSSFVTNMSALIGKDLADDPKRWSAMEQARRTGRVVATGKASPLYTTGDANAGFDVFLSIDRARESTAPAESSAKADGFVFASFSTTKLLEEIFGKNVQPILDFEIFDGNEMSVENLIYDADGILNRDSTTKERRLAKKIPISALGHQWTWCFSTLPQFDQNWQRQLPLLALIGGLIISGCLFGLALSQTKARLTLEGLTSNLKSSEDQLIKANDQLASKVREAENAREQLKAARDYSQCIINSSLDMIVSVDAERRIIEFNRAAELAFGYSKSEILGQSAEILYADKTEADAIAETIKQAGNYTGEIRNRRRDGTTFYSLLTAAPLRDSQGRVIGVMGISHDFTERKRVEEALAAEKERLTVTLRSIGDGVITTDTKGSVTLVNRAAELLTGWKWPEAMGRPLHAIFHIVHEQTHERIATPVEKILSGGEIFGQASDSLLMARDGTERLISNTGAPMWDADGNLIGVVLVFRDITEKRRLEAELLKASKIESLGLLAGGIAHDFNNILTGILGNVSLAKMFSTQNQDVQERLGQAEKACLRARDLTQQLLTFAKGGAPIKKINSMVELIQDSTAFALRGSKVRCEITHAPDLWAVEVDEAQITQVLHNLILNASEAMPEGGIIHVQTQNVFLNGESPLPLPSGKYVRTIVRDHGIGIRPEHLERIFDPYFSTKQRGSGLGLATAYSILKKHNGTITVQSQLGAGTQFEVYLPALGHSFQRPSEASDAPPRGHGRILIMDDEALILELADALLKRLGYDVTQARDGSEAVEHYRTAHAAGEPFAAVIMDLTIPGGMGGKEAIKLLHAIDPNVKAIVSSGYSNDPVVARYREFGFTDVVIKPYQIGHLAKMLDHILKPR